MTQKELIKWARQNLQEVQKLKEKTDQAKEIQDCGFFSKSKSISYEKIAKKFGGLEKSLYLCRVLNDKQQKEKK